MKLQFNIVYTAKSGERLQILVMEKHNQSLCFPMNPTNSYDWQVEFDYYSKTIRYKYQVIDPEGNLITEELVDHRLSFSHTIKEYTIYDVWKNKNFPEHYLNNKIFKNKFPLFFPQKCQILKKHTHLFKIEAPLYNPHWKLVILGSSESLGKWKYSQAKPMLQTELGVWEIALDIPENEFLEYKYGILDESKNEIIGLEYGENRCTPFNVEKSSLYIHADAFFRYKSWELYHGAGVAIPVFSLRSENGFGVGEFLDIKPLADWCKLTGLDLIQVLPINDTSATMTWTDSYPYAAISVYALHPIYLSVEQLDYKLDPVEFAEYEKEKKELNDLPALDYEKVLLGKWKYIKKLFSENKSEIIKDRNFKKFIKDNESWLLPYVAFCLQRDKYGTPKFHLWKTHKKFIAGRLAALFTNKSKDFDTAMLHCWVQYQLHKQLMEAVTYAHSIGISLKGDLPIGIYRYSVEAWAEPELFNLDFQAGAPPDFYSETGQNWEFPTYNWDAMKKDNFQWWKNRFQALEQYFDAMRIDHVLGFFRIWQIPTSATQAVLGYFSPAVPITHSDFEKHEIESDEHRLTQPYITDNYLKDLLGEEANTVFKKFFKLDSNKKIAFKKEFDTQRKLKNYFEENTNPELEKKLLSILTNVLFIKEHTQLETVYHPRFNLQNTMSYLALSPLEKQKINTIYADYFGNRQELLWNREGKEKLSQILTASDMLICAEDLGMVPLCVPMVMDELAIVALKVQRMSAENHPFYNPKYASYLNVVTTSTHDSTTLRKWWKESREVSVDYFKNLLNQYGTAPDELAYQLVEIILQQHLDSNAMLSIFPLQDILAASHQLRAKDYQSERINDPAVFPHYWRYRMHLDCKELMENSSFNHKIYNMIKTSGRAL